MQLSRNGVPFHLRRLDVQFILKCRKLYGDENIDASRYPEYCVSSGLLNSALFVAEMLRQEGVKVKLDQVVDGNCIDRIVHHSKPRICIIEALWVTPDKLRELKKLHPKIIWVIRLHSNTPFLANEGIAFAWIKEYLQMERVIVAGNHRHAIEDLKTICDSKECLKRIAYLPNYYDVRCRDAPFFSTVDVDEILRIGCFGALRPLKNQLQQAVAAIAYCDSKNLKLEFHINSSRIENKGDNVLKNLEALFAGNPKHRLVKHEWLPHHEFLNLVKTMDMGMQVSFTETFNIVAADFVAMGKPVLVSKEIDWLPSVYKTNPTDPDDIKKGIGRVLNCVLGPWRAMRSLTRYDVRSRAEWLDFLFAEEYLSSYFGD